MTVPDTESAICVARFPASDCYQAPTSSRAKAQPQIRVSAKTDTATRGWRTLRQAADLQSQRGRFPSMFDAMAQISQQHGGATTRLAKLLAFGAVGVLAWTLHLGTAASADPGYANASRKLASKPQPDFSGRERTGMHRSMPTGLREEKWLMGPE